MRATGRDEVGLLYGRQNRVEMRGSIVVIWGYARCRFPGQSPILQFHPHSILFLDRDLQTREFQFDVLQIDG